MKKSTICLAAGCVLSLASLSVPAAWAGSGSFYCPSNLVSDQPGVAKFQDPDLVNAWGISASSSSPFWVSDAGTGKSTLYDGNGVKQSLIVTIPPPAGSPAGTLSEPTGQVFNATTDFQVGGAPAISLFATTNGTIAAWNTGTVAVNVVDAANGAAYTGVTIGSNSSGNYLFAANFAKGVIDVFDKNFATANLSGTFSDPNLPAGFSPFNILNLGGTLYVAYAKIDPATGDEVKGRGLGYVDAYDTNGVLLRRVASKGVLNAPWGLAIAPANFGKFSNALLVGNFGNGHISGFNPTTGKFLGQLFDQPRHRVTIDGLWGIIFGNGGAAGPTNTLFFAAGPNDEQNGLFGSIASSSSSCGGY